MKFARDAKLFQRMLIQAFFLIPASILLLTLIHFANRSLDFSAESLYLYLTSNPSEESSLAGSWNWYLHSLLTAAGGDLVVYRKVTIIITFVTVMLFSRSFFRTPITQGRSSVFDFRFLLNVGLSTGAAVFFYRYFLLTPGYNWLAFIGILVALTGALYWIDESTSPIWPVMTLCGLGIATMGRPFSGIVIFLVMMSNTLIRNDVIKFRRNGKLFIGAFFAYLLIHHIFILSIPATINNWRQITLVSQSEESYAIHTLITEFASELIALPIHLIEVSHGLIFVPLVAIILTFIVKASYFKKLALLSSVLALIIFQILLLVGGVFKYLPSTSSQLGYALVTLVTFGILCSYLICINSQRTIGDVIPTSNYGNFETKNILVLSGIVAYSFSSNNGTINQSIGIGVLYVALYLVNISRFAHGSFGTNLMVFNTIFLIAALSQVAIGALQNPYRSVDISKNVYPVTIRGESTLYVSDERASDINEVKLLASLTKLNFSDSYLVDLSPFTPFVAYEMGFKTIETPLLINSQYLAEFARRNDAKLQHAWILTSDSKNSLDVNVLLDELDKTLDSDYENVAVLHGRYCRNSECALSLWKPK